MTQGQTLAEVFGYLDPRSERRRWYAAYSCRRDGYHHFLREESYDRRCVLCGRGLGGASRFVFAHRGRGTRARRHLLVTRPRPVSIVACATCRKLYSPKEYVARYRDRTRNNNPLPIPE